MFMDKNENALNFIHTHCEYFRLYLGNNSLKPFLKKKKFMAPFRIPNFKKKASKHDTFSFIKINKNKIKWFSPFLELEFYEVTSQNKISHKFLTNT